MEQAYLDLLGEVYLYGEDRMDRTGVGTRSLFSKQIECDLNDGFPLITTKKTFFKPILGELLWFVEGSSDERRLAEITYGTRDPSRTTIWTENANAPYWKPKAQFEGDLGRVYGVQWRHWEHSTVNTFDTGEDGIGGPRYQQEVVTTQVDQLAKIIDSIKNNPTDRRMILTAFNPGELHLMALPPCHMFAQFYVTLKPVKKLNCKMYIRSNDLFLGLPFNIASYAILTHMMAQVTNCEVGRLIIDIGDAHIYSNHFEQVKTQLARKPYEPPVLLINKAITDIDSFKMTDFELFGYHSHEAIKAPMAV